MTRWIAVALVLIALPTGAKSLNGFSLDNAIVPVNEIVRGGPPRDGIPALDHPAAVEADKAGFLRDTDRVLGVSVGALARAYPIKILNWHELVNDTLASQHFVVSYCPLCGSGMVFATNAGTGRLVFGVSGLLYNSDVLMFDRNTESLWSQLLGKAIAGKMQGTPLPQLPVLHTTWQRWRELHPDTTVLGTDTGYPRNYSESPYRGYEKSRRLYFDVSNRAPRTYHPKELLLGVQVGDAFKAYPFSELRKSGAHTVEDTVGGEAITVHWDSEADSAHATSDGEVIASGVLVYWFAWYAFHPDTEVFVAPNDLPRIGR